MSTKLDEWKHKKAFADRMRGLANDARNSANCDKLGATVILKDSYRGYYGNSSCSPWGDDVEKAVADVIRHNLRTIIGWAADGAEAVAKRAAVEAKSEAEACIAMLETK